MKKGGLVQEKDSQDPAQSYDILGTKMKRRGGGRLEAGREIDAKKAEGPSKDLLGEKSDQSRAPVLTGGGDPPKKISI